MRVRRREKGIEIDCTRPKEEKCVRRRRSSRKKKDEGTTWEIAPQGLSPRLPFLRANSKHFSFPREKNFLEPGKKNRRSLARKSGKRNFASEKNLPSSSAYKCGNFLGGTEKKKIDPTFVFPQLLFLLFFPSFPLGSGKWSSNSFFLSVEIPTGSFLGGVWPPPPGMECQKSKLVNLWKRDLCLAKRRTISSPISERIPQWRLWMLSFCVRMFGEQTLCDRKKTFRQKIVGRSVLCRRLGTREGVIRATLPSLTPHHHLPSLLTYVFSSP